MRGWEADWFEAVLVWRWRTRRDACEVASNMGERFEWSQKRRTIKEVSTVDMPELIDFMA